MSGEAETRKNFMMKSKSNGLFDPVTQILQYRRHMKWSGLFFILLATGFTLQAQTNSYIEPANTNVVALATNIPALYTNSLMTYSAAPATNVTQLSLEDCVQMTLEHNFELQITRLDPEIAQFVLQSAYGAYDPSLSFSGEHVHSEGAPTIVGTNVFQGRISDANTFRSSLGGLTPWGTSYSADGSASDTYGNFGELSSGAASFTVSQPLLRNFWIDGPRLVIQLDKKRLKFSEEGLKLEIMNRIMLLEKAYYRLIYNRENVIVQQKAVDQAEALVSENEKRLQVGALAPLDLASAQAQAARNRAGVIAAKSDLATQERVIKLYITDNFPAWADVPIAPSGSLIATYQAFNRQKSWQKALTDHPQLVRAKLNAEMAGIQLKYDYNQLFPQLDLSATYGYNGFGKEFSDAFDNLSDRRLKGYSYGGSISIPLGNIAARNNYKADKASLAQFVLTVKRTERDLMISIDNDIGRLQADYDQVLATRALRIYEEQALDAEQKKLQNGKSTTYQVLLVQRDLTTARGAEFLALDNYNEDLAQLSFDEGSTLERLHIKMDVK
jgi:outer membrane protein TolC